MDLKNIAHFLGSLNTYGGLCVHGSYDVYKQRYSFVFETENFKMTGDFDVTEGDIKRLIKTIKGNCRQELGNPTPDVEIKQKITNLK